MDKHRTWFRRVVALGIVANMFFVVPLFFFPETFLGWFDIDPPDPIWARPTGMLLFIISVFYVPAVVDMDRYRANAWFHTLPSRTCGATFFILAVLVFDYDTGYIAIGLVDLVFGLTAVLLLMKITRLEREQGAPVRLFSANAPGT